MGAEAEAEAEADPALLYGAYGYGGLGASAYGYGLGLHGLNGLGYAGLNGLGYAGLHGLGYAGLPAILPAATVVAEEKAADVEAAAAPYAHYYGKRSADAEADPALLYGSYGYSPY